MRRFVNRIRRLERRTFQQGPNRTLVYDALNSDAATALANVGKPGKYICVPSFGSDADYERALIRQQRELIAGNRRIPAPPKKEAPPVQHQAALIDAAPTSRVNSIRKRMRFNK